MKPTETYLPPTITAPNQKVYPPSFHSTLALLPITKPKLLRRIALTSPMRPLHSLHLFQPLPNPLNNRKIPQIHTYPLRPPNSRQKTYIRQGNLISNTILSCRFLRNSLVRPEPILH